MGDYILRKMSVFIQIISVFSAMINTIEPRGEKRDEPIQHISRRDDREIVRSLGKLLELEGYRVKKAYNGMEALEHVVAYAREKGLYVIMDAKRGDIGTTAEAYARPILAVWTSAASTMHPMTAMPSRSTAIWEAMASSPLRPTVRKRESLSSCW
mgnify:CR=1 FL=1